MPSLAITMKETMYTLHSTKLFFILLLSATSFNATHCMLSQWKYEPYEQPYNPEITEKRKLISSMLDENNSIENKSLTKIADAIAVRKVTSQEKSMVCFGYAMAQTTGSTTPLTLGYNNDRTSINIEDFFDQTADFKENAFVVYVLTKKRRYIQHFGFAKKGNIIESKWGGHKQIVQHRLFDIPYEYGKAASFWIPKPEFTTKEGKRLLLETIQNNTGHADKKIKPYKSIPTKVVLKDRIKKS